MDDRIFSKAAYTIRRKPAMRVSATSVPMFRLPKTRSYTWSMYRGPTNASRFMKKLKTMAVAKPGRMALEASTRKDGRLDMGYQLPGGWQSECLIENISTALQPSCCFGGGRDC